LTANPAFCCFPDEPDHDYPGGASRPEIALIAMPISRWRLIVETYPGSAGHHSLNPLMRSLGATDMPNARYLRIARGLHARGTSTLCQTE
jgi:hypothetical protein